MQPRTIATGAWQLDGLSVTTSTGTVTFHYFEPDEGGAAGVREPRRPSPAPLAPMAAALDEPSAASRA